MSLAYLGVLAKGTGGGIFCRSLSIVFLLHVAAATGAIAEMPYFTNLNSALASAGTNGRMIILYTGSKELCPGHDPKAFFFGSVLGTHLPLGTRSNAYVICEQFLTNVAHDARGEPSRAFLAEVSRYDALFTRYGIHVFWPSATILDGSGATLSGPYYYSGPDNTFVGTQYDGYEVLQEYGSANPPLTSAQGRSNLLAAITVTNKDDVIFGIFRAKYDKSRNQREILLDNGFPSKSYELGKEISFVVRECGAETFDFGGGRGATEIVATGSLGREEELTENVLVLVRLNGAYLRGHMLDTGSWTGAGKVKFQPGEYYLNLVLPHKPAADMLLRALEKLRPSSAPGQ
jgi:hypothetical protein